MSREVQNKLLNYEVSPPAGLWEKIAGELDESELHQKFPAALHAMEVPPPPATWNRIASTLHPAESATMAPRHRIAPVWKYAAAAALIGVLAFGAVKIISNTSTGSSIAESDTTSVSIPATTTEKKSTEESTDDTAGDDARNDAALEQSKQTFARLDMPAARRGIQTRNFISHPVELTASPGELNPEDTYRELDQTLIQPFTVAQPEPVTDLTQRYLMMMTPDGNIIRMSKKWSSLVCCVSGEDQDEDCKNQLKRWREKLASSLAAPSSGNFMDILTLVNSLQDNN